MQGVYYLLSIVAVFVVFIWYIQNDGLAEGEPTRGLLAMKEPEIPSSDQDAKERHKAGQSANHLGRRRPFNPWHRRSQSK